MKAVIDDTLFCAHCFDRKDPVLRPLRFTCGCVTPPTTLYFCTECYVKILGGDDEVRATMRDRYRLILDHKYGTNFGAKSNSIMMLS